MTGARLTGMRVGYDAMPARVRAWVAHTLGGEPVDVVPRTGGMSPAVATSLVLADGRRAFVKAVGTEIHPETPTHFRYEASLLRGLPPAPYRADLLAAYDDGDWVALLLEDIDGGHPDWGDPADRALVLDAVLEQSAELTPPPAGLPLISMRESARRHLAALEEVTPAELAALPPDVRADIAWLAALKRDSIGRQQDETMCHWDIRHDNIVMRVARRQPVFVDWGMSRAGPRWGDVLCFALEWVHEPVFDSLVDRLGLSEVEQADVTGFLAGLGGFCLVASTHPAHPSLPMLPQFRRDLGLRCLAGVRRRTA